MKTLAQVQAAHRGRYIQTTYDDATESRVAMVYASRRAYNDDDPPLVMVPVRSWDVVGETADATIVADEAWFSLSAARSWAKRILATRPDVALVTLRVRGNVVESIR